jgi:hypothetical protein
MRRVAWKKEKEERKESTEEEKRDISGVRELRRAMNEKVFR